MKFTGEQKPGDDPLKGARGELIEIRAEFEPDPSSVLSFRVRGVEIAYDVRKQELSVHGRRVPAPLRAGKQRLIVYTDRTGLEVFASDGLIYVPMPANLDPRVLDVTASIAGGPIQFDSLEVHELRSIWGVQGP